MRLKLFLAALILIAALPVYSQVVPAAREGGLPLVVGGGISDYSLDFGNSKRMEGVTVWVDWHPKHLPSFLHGIGIEAEGRDINFGRPSDLSKMRQDTGMGGVIYTWRRYHSFHPYAKGLAGMGSIDFPSHNPFYTHDTRSIYAPGGGVDYHAWRNIWVRADYEYQFWPNLFGRNHSLNPNGITFGAVYDFRPFRN